MGGAVVRVALILSVAFTFCAFVLSFSSTGDLFVPVPAVRTLGSETDDEGAVAVTGDPPPAPEWLTPDDNRTPVPPRDSAHDSDATGAGNKAFDPVPARLGQALDAYERLHADILDGTLPRRFLLFRTSSQHGLGNKLSVLMAVMLLGVVSRRAVLVDWPASHGVKITHRSDLHAAERAASLANLGLSDLLQAPGIEWDAAPWLEQLARGKIPQFKGSADQLACSSVDGMLKGDVVLVKGWDTFIPALALNPAVRDMLGDDLAAGEHARLNLMHLMLSRYFRPLPPVTAAVEEAFRKISAGATQGLLGVHIRAHTAQTGPLVIGKDYMRQVADCAVASELGRWLIVSDDTDMRESMRQAIAHLAPDVRPEIVWYEEGEITRETDSGILTAFIELQLLARCDAVMHLAGTTFGRLAGAMRGRPTRIVTHKGKCRVRPFSEPCYYGWKGRPRCVSGEKLPEEGFHSHNTCWSDQ